MLVCRLFIDTAKEAAPNRLSIDILEDIIRTFL